MSAALPKDVNAFAARCFVDPAGHKLPYRLLLPETITKGVSYPLVMLLHGADERGTDNVAQLSNGFAALLTKSRRAFPCIAIVPQCPKDSRWVEVDWCAPSHPLPSIPSVPLHAALALVDALLAGVASDFLGSLVPAPATGLPAPATGLPAPATGLPAPATGLIDPTRLYLVGLSMGGYGVWDAVSRQPWRFAAAVPICGGAAEDQAASLCVAGLPIWAFHGARDPVVPVQRSRRMVAALQGCGAPVHYTEYPEGGHDAWTWALQDPKLWPWLFGQRNKNHPPSQIPRGAPDAGKPY